MRRPAIIATLALVAGFFLIGTSSADAASYTPSSYAARLLSLVNQARGQHGLRPLTATSGTASVASSWTSHMAATKTLSHNPSLQQDLESHGSAHWMTYGENVGQGSASNPDNLFNAYMNSPEHRDNILTAAYHYVGVGVVFTGRASWNTFDFVDAYGSGSATKATTKTTTTTHHATTQHATVQHATVPQPKPAATPARVVHQAPSHAKHHAAAQHKTARKPAAHHVQVKGFQTHSPAPRPLPVDNAAPVSDTALATATHAGSTSAPKALLVALAVLVLAAVARRWVLTTR